MRPSFNTAGPCFPDEHYMLPPERRLGRVMELIDDGKYSTLHAGRQTGKTTSAQWLAAHYNAGDRFRAVWFDLETARDKPEPGLAFRPVLTMLDRGVRQMLSDIGPPAGSVRFLEDPDTAVLRYLSDLAARSPRPLVVFFDETDCLVGAAMVSFLTQLRTGYLSRRDSPFPHSIALIGPVLSQVPAATRRDFDRAAADVNRNRGQLASMYKVVKAAYDDYVMRCTATGHEGEGPVTIDDSTGMNIITDSDIQHEYVMAVRDEAKLRENERTYLGLRLSPAKS